MRASMIIVGFKPPDETFKKHKAVWDACDKAGVNTPKETLDYFGLSEPDDLGVEVSQRDLEHSGCLKKYAAEMCDGFEVEIDKIPKGTKFIRFYMSY